MQAPLAAVIRLDQLPLLGLPLLILRRLLLAGSTAARHSAHHRPHSCALAGVSVIAPIAAPPAAPRAAPPSVGCHRPPGPSVVGRIGGHHRWVNARRLLGPGGALGVILALLLRALAFCGVDDRLLCLRGADQREHCYPNT